MIKYFYPNYEKSKNCITFDEKFHDNIFPFCWRSMVPRKSKNCACFYSGSELLTGLTYKTGGELSLIKIPRYKRMQLMC